MSDQVQGAAVAAGFGAGFLLAGAVLLLQELGLLTMRWSLVLPLIVTIVGVVVVFSGIIGAHHARRSASTRPSGSPLGEPQP